MEKRIFLEAGRERESVVWNRIFFVFNLGLYLVVLKGHHLQCSGDPAVWGSYIQSPVNYLLGPRITSWKTIFGTRGRTQKEEKQDMGTGLQDIT